MLVLLLLWKWAGSWFAAPSVELMRVFFGGDSPLLVADGFAGDSLLSVGARALKVELVNAAMGGCVSKCELGGAQLTSSSSSS